MLPWTVCYIIVYVARFQGVDVVEATRLVYTSRLYEQLADEATKLWHCGPWQLYLMLCDERQWPQPEWVNGTMG